MPRVRTVDKSRFMSGHSVGDTTDYMYTTNIPKTCAVCGKTFFIHCAEVDWGYKVNKYERRVSKRGRISFLRHQAEIVCTYQCMRKVEHETEEMLGDYDAYIKELD